MLMDYWLGDLPAAEEEAVETHLLSCDACGDRLRHFIALADAIRKIAQEGNLRVVVSNSFLERAAQEGLRIRQYAPAPGGSVQCTVTAEDDLVIARLAADLRKAPRVDVCYSDPGGTVRVRDIPVNTRAGEVLLNAPIAQLRAAAAHVAVIQLVAVNEDGDQVLGEYTFNHTPSP
jgi:anti-sigma factor RsiW